MTDFFLPGHALAIDFDNKIRVTTRNALKQPALTVRVLTMLLDGRIQKHSFPFTPSSAEFKTVKTFGIDSGWLIGVSIHTDVTSLVPGEFYVQVELVRGETSSPGAANSLIAGYLFSGNSMSWPDVNPKNAADIEYQPLRFAPANPAVATDLSYDGALNTLHRVDVIKLVFTTDANVADRRMILKLSDFGTYFAQITAQTVQAASLAYTYYFTRNGQYDQLTGTVYNLRLPEFIAPEQLGIETAIENKQAGDQISSVRLVLGTKFRGSN